MRLLAKISLSNIINTVVLLILSGFMIYLITDYLTKEEQKEEIAEMATHCFKSIKQGKIPSNPPFLEIDTIEVMPEINSEYSTVEIPDIDDDGELETYLQLYSYKIINGTEYLIIIRDKIIDREDLFMLISGWIVIIIIILTMGFFAAGYFSSKMILRDFYKILNSAKSFSLSSLSGSIAIRSSISEFTELSKELENLTKRVIEDYQRSKELTENISHELRTPIAIIKSKIELLIQGQNISDSQLALIEAPAKTQFSKYKQIS
jgi:signal transduction histidine kinase